jgi:hypothetical protein
MYRLIAPTPDSDDNKVKEEAQAVVSFRHNLPIATAADAGTTSWFNPMSISSIILQTVCTTVDVVVASCRY